MTSIFLQTPRLTVVPMTLEIVRAEIDDPTRFRDLLHADIPENWPPELMRDALPWFEEQLSAQPDRVGWLGWYAIYRRPSPESDVIVGSGGFLGTPEDGKAEVGYSVLPQFQGQGFGTEMVRTLVDWALTQDGVTMIVSETGEANLASRRLLEKIGFVPTGPGREPGDLRFEYGA